MAADLVTVKISRESARAIRVIAAGRELKQYEVVEVLIDLINKAEPAIVLELFAQKAGDN
jgi:hypothetical protein